MTATKKYPFKFLDAYSQADHDFFFGREEEVAALYEMVFQTDILLVYGASGTGKTSLIQCGLANKFQPCPAPDYIYICYSPGQIVLHGSSFRSD